MTERFRDLRRHFSVQTVALAVLAVVVVGGGSAVAANLITGQDVQNGSLGAKELKSKVRATLPTRVTAALPSKRFEATNASVSNTPDGVELGPYANGGSSGGSLCTSRLNGQPLSALQHAAYEARYTSDGDTSGVGAPYFRVFLENDAHDAIFSPNTQPPDPDTEEGPFHTWAATAGLWRYDDDAGSGGQYGVNGAPFSQLVSDHGTDVINSICITTGFGAGTNLNALIRSVELNSKKFEFGL